jgi:hypothetical protein
MKYVLVGIAVIGGFYGLHRLAVWAEARGWIYYREKRGSSGALANAFLEVQSMFEPSARAALEVRVKDDHESDESGDPPR